MSLIELIKNTWTDHKYTISGLATSGTISSLTNYFSDKFELGIKDAFIGAGILTYSIIADYKNRKNNELNDMLYESTEDTRLSDEGHHSSALKIGKNRKIISVVDGKSKMFSELKIVVRPGDDLDEKHKDNPALYFAKKVTDELHARYENAKKDEKILAKFSSKKAFDSQDPVTGRCIKRKDSILDKKDGFTEITYELDGFLGQDNETVTLKARPIFHDSKMALFRRIFDEKVVNHLKNDPNYYKQLQEEDVACLFCDIRGFTEWSESNPKEEVLNLLTNYYKTSRSVSNKHDLTYDKYEGDGLLFVFGPPYDTKKPHSSMKTPAYNSICSAIDMRDAFEQVKNGHDLGVGVGIYFGKTLMGIITDDIVYSYTGVGRTYNRAARLCGKAKSNEIIISKTLYDKLNEEKHANKDNLLSRIEAAGSVKVKGVKEPIEIYKVN